MDAVVERQPSHRAVSVLSGAIGHPALSWFATPAATRKQPRRGCRLGTIRTSASTREPVETALFGEPRPICRSCSRPRCLSWPRPGFPPTKAMTTARRRRHRWPRRCGSAPSRRSWSWLACWRKDPWGSTGTMLRPTARSRTRSCRSRAGLGSL